MKKKEVYNRSEVFDLMRSLESLEKAKKVRWSKLLERIVLNRLARRAQPDAQEEMLVQQLQQSAAQAFGTIHGGDPHRSEDVSQRMKSKLRERRASQRTH